MKATKKLIGASVALVAALAVSVGSTFAWFTTQNKSTVSNISAKVTTTNSSLEMKLTKADGGDITGQNWGYELNLAGFFDGDGVKLDALTYDKTLNDNKGGLKKYQGVSAETTTPDDTTGHITSGNFVEFYLAFRSQDEQEIRLGTSTLTSVANGSVVKSVVADGNWTGTDFGEGSFDTNPIQTKAQDAARVGFASAGAKLTDETRFASAKVWAPHEQYIGGGTSGTEQDSKSGFYKVRSSDSKVLAQVVDEKISGESDLSGKYTNPNYTGLDCKGASDETENSTIVKMVTGEKVNNVDYYYAYIHVFMWIEGTDGDCFNNILGDTITLNLSFEATEPTD